MNLLIMGVAGSGKGTMSEKIVEEYKIPHISTGDMFRQAMAKETPLGLEAKKYIDEGHLVPDALTIELMHNRLEESDCKDGYLLDGFPRTIAQAEALEGMTQAIDRPLQLVINLVVGIDALAPRITGRRVCSKCGAIYHIKFSPPKRSGVCDLCGGSLIHRSDDTVEQLAVRLQDHVLLTKPVLDYYKKEGLVVDIDASQDIELVWRDIKSALEKIR